jgi:hypothetical protein
VTLAEAQNAPLGIAVNATDVYWVNEEIAAVNFIDGTVMSVPIAGGTPNALASNQSPYGIALDATNVYWTGVDSAAVPGEATLTGAVLRISLAGGAPTTLASAPNVPAQIAVDGTSVYWTNRGSFPNYTDGTVMKIVKQ